MKLASLVCRLLKRASEWWKEIQRYETEKACRGSIRRAPREWPLRMQEVSNQLDNNNGIQLEEI